jgi:SsrA-binding protein
MAIPIENKDRPTKLITSNRKALHEFFVDQTFEAGIVLQGTEVKSLRSGKSSLQDAYAAFPNKDSDDFYIMNLHIPEYTFGNIANHKPKRPRKLLITKREARKLRTAVSEKGMTIIPLSLYFSGPYVKVEIGLVRAKKKYDKREELKTKDVQKELKRKYGV